MIYGKCQERMKNICENEELQGATAVCVRRHDQSQCVHVRIVCVVCKFFVFIPSHQMVKVTLREGTTPLLDAAAQNGVNSSEQVGCGREGPAKGVWAVTWNTMQTRETDLLACGWDADEPQYTSVIKVSFRTWRAKMPRKTNGSPVEIG